jgi:hypothetical protein
VFTRISTILSAALILASVSSASAASHGQVKRYYHYNHQPVTMLLENKRAALTYWQNEANTEAAIRFQEQWDNSY